MCARRDPLIPEECGNLSSGPCAISSADREAYRVLIGLAQIDEPTPELIRVLNVPTHRLYHSVYGIQVRSFFQINKPGFTPEHGTSRAGRARPVRDRALSLMTEGTDQLDVGRHRDVALVQEFGTPYLQVAYNAFLHYCFALSMRNWP
jgi:hypothetical protein